MKIEDGQAYCSNIVNRKEKHGDEKVAAVSVKLEQIQFDAELLNELCPISGSSLIDTLYIDQNPRLQQLYPITVSTELEPYRVRINDVVMKHCTIKNIKIMPDVGRKLIVALQVNTLLEDQFAAPLARAQQEEVSIDIQPAQADVDKPEQAKAA